MSIVSTGVITTLDPVSGRTLGRAELSAYNEVYAAIGVGRDQLFAWLAAHGPRGVGSRGEVLSPDFPVLSRVAWMYVDPVDITADEIKDLIGECERAAARTTDLAAKRDLATIRSAASNAQTHSAIIRFGA